MALDYEVYVQAGREAVPGVDTPAAVVTAPDVTAALAGLTYTPGVTHFVSVVAVNDQGRAESWPVVCVAVDGGGTPLMTPTPVTRLRVMALAGGLVRVRWVYDELVAMSPAAQFRVTVTPQSPGLVEPEATVVAHVAPRREYWTDVGPLADGLWLVRVFSETVDEEKETAVTGAFVRSDATGPAVTLPGLEVS